MFVLLIKSSLVIVILLAFYKLFLEKESFFALNRFFLLFCLILAVALPFISLPELVENQGYISNLLETEIVETSDLSEENINKTPTQESFTVDFDANDPEKIASNDEIQVQLDHSEDLSIETEEPKKDAAIASTTERPTRGIVFWLLCIYGFGVLILSLNLIAQILTTLSKAIKNEDKISTEDGVIVNLTSQSEPCSFFNYIFIHPDSYDFETYEQILAHEKMHVKQRHSVDLLLAEIAVILMWFNPFVWLFRKEVEKNIEYQTDALLISKSAQQEKKGYQLNLLKIATYNKPLTITTNYNQSLIKQRILKMNAKKSNPYSYWKYAFVAPVLLTLILAMNEPYQASNFIPDESSEALENTTNNDENATYDIEGDSNLEELHQIVENLRQQLKADKIVEVDDILFQYENGKIMVNDQELSEEQTETYLQFLKEQGVTIVGDRFKLHILPDKEHWKVSGKIDFKATEESETEESDDFGQFMQAIKEDNLETVKLYLKKDIDLNRKDEDGFTPLLLAAYKKHDAIAKAIIAKTAELVNLNKEEDWTPSDLSMTDYKNFELFMRAIDDGDKETVIYFLEKGKVDVNGIGKNQFTPLMLAASEDHPEIVRLLIDRGAKVNFMNDYGWTALIEAADEGAYASAVVLIEAGADIDLHEKEGGRSAVVMAVTEGHLNVLELLLESGADFSNYHDGYTPLHGAAEEGQLSILKMLIEKIDVNFTDHYKRTALFYAAEEGHSDIVEYLVSKGAEINLRERSGRTALSYAAEERQEDIVRFLLEQGADASFRDEEGFTALDYAIDEAATEVINLLLKTDSGTAIVQENNSAMLEAVEEGSMRTIQSLLDAGGDINASNRRGWTPLMEAADEEDLDLVKFLIRKGANINATSNIGWTALIEAVDEKSIQVVRYLINEGADVNAATTSEFREGVSGNKHYLVHSGWTPLFEAIDEGAVMSAELLHKQGADVNASISRTLIDRENGTRIRYENWTLLMDAVERERMEMIQFLLNNGADVNAKNSLGETALDVAKRTENELIVKMVKKKK